MVCQTEIGTVRLFTETPPTYAYIDVSGKGHQEGALTIYTFERPNVSLMVHFYRVAQKG